MKQRNQDSFRSSVEFATPFIVNYNLITTERDKRYFKDLKLYEREINLDMSVCSLSIQPLNRCYDPRSVKCGNILFGVLAYYRTPSGKMYTDRKKERKRERKN